MTSLTAAVAMALLTIAPAADDAPDLSDIDGAGELCVLDLRGTVHRIDPA